MLLEIASFVVRDNNFYDAHWLSGNPDDIADRDQRETPPRPSED